MMVVMMSMTMTVALRFTYNYDGDDDDGGGCDDDNDDNDDDGGSEIYLCNHFGSFPKRTSPAFPFSASLGAINTGII